MAKFKKPNWKARGRVKLRREKKMPFRPNVFWLISSIRMFTSNSFQHFIDVFSPSGGLRSASLSSADGRLWLILLSLLAMWNPPRYFLWNPPPPLPSQLSAGFTLWIRSLIAYLSLPLRDLWCRNLYICIFLASILVSNLWPCQHLVV